MKLSIVVAGPISAARYQMAAVAAVAIKSHVKVELKPMVEVEFDAFRTAKCRDLNELSYDEDTLVYSNEEFIGGCHAFITWANERFGYAELRPEGLYEVIAETEYADYMHGTGYTYAFLEISIDGAVAGKLTFELYNDLCPETCENFLTLCSEENVSKKTGKPLTYIGSKIHRIVPDGWFQAGELGKESSVGDGGVFADECFAVEHTSRGLIGMVNEGRHTNTSQFYVTWRPMTPFDRKFVAFGRLIEGSALMDRLLDEPLTKNECPERVITVSAAGPIELDF